MAAKYWPTSWGYGTSQVWLLACANYPLSDKIWYDYKDGRVNMVMQLSLSLEPCIHLWLLVWCLLWERGSGVSLDEPGCLGGGYPFPYSTSWQLIVVWNRKRMTVQIISQFCIWFLYFFLNLSLPLYSFPHPWKCDCSHTCTAKQCKELKLKSSLSFFLLVLLDPPVIFEGTNPGMEGQGHWGSDRGLWQWHRGDHWPHTPHPNPSPREETREPGPHSFTGMVCVNWFLFRKYM